MGAAHRAEMRELRAFLGQRLVVELLCLVWVEAEIELVLPAEFETRFRECVVTDLCTGMPLGKVRGVRRDLVRYDAVLDVVLVGQPEVLLGRHVTRSEEHTSELQSRFDLVCRLLLEQKNTVNQPYVRGKKHKICKVETIRGQSI